MEGPLSPDKNPLFSDPSNIPVEYWLSLKKDYYNLNFLGFNTEVLKKERLIIIKNFPYKPNFQVYLIILKYLLVKDKGEIYLNDNWVIPKDLKGGIHFFDKSHPLNVREIFEKLKNLENIKRSCLDFRGVELNLGDFSYEFFLFPEIKIRYIFYEGDDEFPSEITVNFQKGLENYFNLDIIWAMVNVITKGLIENFNKF